jgi:hypothetical protein
MAPVGDAADAYGEHHAPIPSSDRVSYPKEPTDVVPLNTRRLGRHEPPGRRVRWKRRDVDHSPDGHGREPAGSQLRCVGRSYHDSSAIIVSLISSFVGCFVG